MKIFVKNQYESKKLSSDEVEVLDFGTKLIRGIFTEVLYSIMLRTVGRNDNNKYKDINTSIKLKILDSINSIKNLNDLFEVVINFCKEILLKFNIDRITQYMDSILKFKECMSLEFTKSILYNSLNGIFKLKVNRENNEKRK